jgi:acetylornithine/N-succinyldiaminopimelate aminotransferase
VISSVLPVYARLDVAFERGEGAYLFDESGRRYLDFCSGIAVSCLGHAHPHLVEALTAQARKLWHTSNLYRVPGQEILSQRLIAASFADTVFFTNSGVEAWECGVKTVRRHFYARGLPAKNRIISIEGAFHGRTLGAISATRSEKMTGGFGPLMDGFDIVPFGDVAAIRAAIGPATAAIMVEPIIGEGGVRVWPADQLREIRDLADEHGLLLYFDEIQCGMGRTGKLFACEWSGVTPDVMCIAKGIGGGFPLGACLATEHAAGGMTAGYHGSTYGGNPLAMAVGNAVLDVMLEPGFLPGVVEMSGLLHERLNRWMRETPGVVEEVRGVGYMIGLRLSQGIEPRDFVKSALEQGLLLVPAADNVVRVLPPLIIGDAEIDQAIRLLDGVAAGWRVAA